MHNTTSHVELSLAASSRLQSSVHLHMAGAGRSWRTWLRPGTVHMQAGRLAQVAGKLPLPLHSPIAQAVTAKPTEVCGGASPARSCGWLQPVGRNSPSAYDGMAHPAGFQLILLWLDPKVVRDTACTSECTRDRT
jgi:hypothetical protein